MRIIDLMRKDLQQLLRDWKTAFFLLVMPIVFTLLMGYVIGGAMNQGDPRLPVGIINQDKGEMGALLADLISSSEGIRPDLDYASRPELEESIADQDTAGGVIIPPDYSAALRAGNAPQVVLLADPATPEGTTVQNSVQTAVLRLLGAVETAQISAQTYAEEAGFESKTQRRQFFDQAVKEAVTAWENPSLTVTTTMTGEEDQEDEANAFTHTSPGMMLQFAIAGLIGSAEILVRERKVKALKRLLTTAISRTEIILGHYFAMFALIFTQLLILITFGQLALNVDYLHAPLGTLLMTVSTALWVAALGLLIGVIGSSEEQVVILSMIPMFVLSALGGAWMPLSETSQAFQTIGYLLPSAWTMEGYQNIIVRGFGLESVWLPLLIMLAYTAVFFGAAVWRFREE
jgi:ABC-2 type transport system permease protein